MLHPVALFIGWRYSLARKHNLLLSFVSLVSMLGISLGVLVLIVALSVINGSIISLRTEALKSVPHATLSGPAVATDWRAWQQQLVSHPDVLAAAPIIEGQGVIRHQGRITFIRVRGVNPQLEPGVSDNPSPLQTGLLNRLAATPNGIILGTRLATELGIFSAGEVSVLGLGSLLARQPTDALGLTVLGSADFGLHGNSNLALINLHQAQALYANDPGTALAVRIKVNDVLRAGDIAESVLAGRDGVEVLPWYQAQASLFNALNLEKMLTSFMLLMIVIIGAVNIISTLVMVVADKSADIAILRTLGASRQTIMWIFVIQGLIAGLAGIAVGTLCGVLLATNINTLSLGLERLINSLFSDANVFLLSHLQTRVVATEVLIVGVVALAVSLLATLYPAWRASRVQPAAVLRHE